MTGKGNAGRRVLITGGAGFIGSHLCEAYLKDDWTVICLDNFYTGRKQNVQHLMADPRFSLVEHDITDPYEAEVDLILNFACPASPVHYQADAIKTFRTSVIGTLNLLELARKKGARFCQASTSEVYGDPLQHPQKEEYWGNVNPIGIRSCYDEGKRAGETLCFDFLRIHNVDIRVIRIFNTYGPRMDPRDGRVVSNFVVQALDGKDITIYGNGEQTRSFCFVDDLVRGIIAFCKQTEHHGPMNLGNDKEFTVKELADKVLSMTASPSKLVHNPLPQDDPRVRRPDLTNANNWIAYQPRISLNEGLEKTITYFRENRM